MALEPPIFESYEWDIYNEETDSRIGAFSHHKNCPAYKGSHASFDTLAAMNSWWLEDIKQECVVCHKAVPENIQALVMLYVYGKETT